ncbi:hypothetical protein [Candidatus Protochlamydia amoebophila]|uniref:Uncharacterized protein n=1 Tax=Protochlamydia amoebophila (strain UWE25) TaxID=264201 RepID=Q6MA48_PARUW|nr:hypothetical protein [Candidatus Protochlamydia amoebophila]CAF24551.1 unnamed protein product [Candidatus Protochlamydia amoebophila UWE25]
MDYYDLLAIATSAEKNSFVVKFAALCDKIGLLQFRQIRHFFSISFTNIQKINEYFIQKHQDLHRIKISKIAGEDEWNRMCKRWKVSIYKHDHLIIMLDQLFKHRMEGSPHVASPNNADLQRKLASINPDLFQWGVETLNKRTQLMQGHLAHIPGYKQTENQLQIDGVTYQVVTSEVTQFAEPEKPLVSCGSSASREMILLDPQNSPALNDKYNQFEQLIMKFMRAKGKPNLSPKELLILTNYFMSTIVFPKDSLANERINKLVANSQNDAAIYKINSQPCIPIDVFIVNQVGVCRHHSLVAAFFLDKFIQTHPDIGFTGKVQIMRDELVKDNRVIGAHAWITLGFNNDQILLLDSLNGFLGDLNEEDFQKKIRKVFGDKAIRHQLEKAKRMLQKGNGERVVN